MGSNVHKNKIAIILPSLEGGGAERVASELSCFLSDEGHRVYIFTEKKHTHYVFKGKIVVLNHKKTVSLLNQDISDVYHLAKEIRSKKRKYDIDIAISFMEKYNLANILSKGKEKVIIRICTILSARKDLQGIYYNKSILKFLYNKADTIIVQSRYGKNDMIENYGIKNSKLKIIPNAVIPRKIEGNAEWVYGKKVVLSVNRIHPVKQQRVMIEAMKEVVKSIPEAKLLLVGNNTGQYAKNLLHLVKKEGLMDCVIFTGLVNNVEYYMRNSQVFVLTSLVEGFPNVLVEAMNQGIPIVSTDFIGPCREILGVNERLGYGKYGIVTPRVNENKKNMENDAGIKKLSGVLIEMLLDSEMNERYREASYKRARHYSKEKVESVWKEII